MTQQEWNDQVAGDIRRLVQQGAARAAEKAKAEDATMCKPVCRPECACGGLKERIATLEDELAIAESREMEWQKSAVHLASLLKSRDAAAT